MKSNKKIKIQGDHQDTFIYAAFIWNNQKKKGTQDRLSEVILLCIQMNFSMAQLHRESRCNSTSSPTAGNEQNHAVHFGVWMTLLYRCKPLNCAPRCSLLFIIKKIKIIIQSKKLVLIVQECNEFWIFGLIRKMLHVTIF